MTELWIGDEKIVANFRAPKTQAHGCVLIAPAMGVPQTFYASLAEWLATKGFLAATFDYRGTGASQAKSTRDTKADVVDWGRVDCTKMIEALDARAPGMPMYWIGHSLGGQLLPFAENRDRVSKLITIATGSGYYKENAPALRKKVWWFWFVAVPVMTPLYGYFPGRALKKVGDLPKGVITQWRKWCLHPDYAVGVEGESVRNLYASVTLPLTSISFSDDEMMSERNVESIHGFYTGARKKMIRLEPETPVGHFGFFKPKFRDTLWENILLPELRIARTSAA